MRRRPVVGYDIIAHATGTRVPSLGVPLLTLTPFFRSCNWIIGRALHEDIPPMGMTFFRWFFAVPILAPSMAMWSLYDERLQLYRVAGIALILTGIALTTRRGRAIAPAGTD